MSAPASIDSRPLAVFDFDGTLVRGDSFLPFVLSYARSRRRLRPFLTLPVYLGLYATRLLSDRRAKERVLVSFLRGEPKALVTEHASRFWDRWVRPRLYAEVLARLREHQSAGHRVVLLSASPEVYIPVIGQFLAVDEVICTRVKALADSWDGALDGPNCKGAEKVTALQRYLQMDTPPRGSSAYGDSRSDLPVLRWVESGFLVRRGRLEKVPAAPGSQ